MDNQFSIRDMYTKNDLNQAFELVDIFLTKSLTEGKKNALYLRYQRNIVKVVQGEISNSLVSGIDTSSLRFNPNADFLNYNEFISAIRLKIHEINTGKKMDISGFATQEKPLKAYGTAYGSSQFSYKPANTANNAANNSASGNVPNKSNAACRSSMASNNQMRLSSNSQQYAGSRYSNSSNANSSNAYGSSNINSSKSAQSAPAKSSMYTYNNSDDYGGFDSVKSYKNYNSKNDLNTGQIKKAAIVALILILLFIGATFFIKAGKSNDNDVTGKVTAKQEEKEIIIPVKTVQNNTQKALPSSGIENKNATIVSNEPINAPKPDPKKPVIAFIPNKNSTADNNINASNNTVQNAIQTTNASAQTTVIVKSNTAKSAADEVIIEEVIVDFPTNSDGIIEEVIVE